MKNKHFFQLGVVMILCLSFQKLIAQPQFIVQDRVVLLVPSQNESQIVQDKVVLLAPPQTETEAVSWNSVHKKLLALSHKKEAVTKNNSFDWYNPHPTNSMQVEGYSIIISSKTNKISQPQPIAEIRFVRQKAIVCIDLKKSDRIQQSDIQTVTYSENFRKALIETVGGHKISLSIGNNGGKINEHRRKIEGKEKIEIISPQSTSDYEIRIYKTPNLF